MMLLLIRGHLKRGHMPRFNEKRGRSRESRAREKAGERYRTRTQSLRGMGSILDRFAQALSMTIVCQQSLAARVSAQAGDEEETLRVAIRLLKNVYNELDRVEPNP
jgi:hypothetical protein